MVLVCLIWTSSDHIVCNDQSVVLDPTTQIIGRITEYCHNPLLKVVDTFYNINKGK